MIDNGNDFGDGGPTREDLGQPVLVVFLDFWNRFDEFPSRVDLSTEVADVSRSSEGGVVNWVEESECLHELKGEVDDKGMWCWDGEGDPVYRGSKVLRLTVQR